MKSHSVTIKLSFLSDLHAGELRDALTEAEEAFRREMLMFSREGRYSTAVAISADPSPAK